MKVPLTPAGTRAGTGGVRGPCLQTGGLLRKRRKFESAELNIEEAMIEIARLILGRECEGYGVK